jgi:hypothetical protein
MVTVLYHVDREDKADLITAALRPSWRGRGLFGV